MTQTQAAFVVGVFILTLLIFITQHPDDFRPHTPRSGTGGLSLGRLLGAARFLVALLVGASYRLWTLLKAICGEARGIWVALTDKHQYVSDEIKEQRLEHCRRCSLYFKPLGTCGTPLRKIKDGCHCYMEKAAGAYHECYIFENGVLFSDEQGWPPHLNSSVIDAHESPKTTL